MGACTDTERCVITYGIREGDAGVESGGFDGNSTNSADLPMVL